jgi:phage terminase large subunit-like protein
MSGWLLMTDSVIKIANSVERGAWSDARELLFDIEKRAYKHFIPNGAVAEYIRAVGSMMDKRVFLFASANAVGKTAGVINILANIIFPNKSKWFDYPRFNDWQFPRKFWYVSEHTTLKETVGPEIEKWWPAGEYYLNKASGYPIHVETGTGWVGDFKRYDQDVSKFESATLGCVVFDEPPPEAIYNACISRLRMGGIILMPMTPLFKAAFVKDRIVENNDYAYVQVADIEENCKEHGVRGILDHSTIEWMASQMEDEEKEARLHGKFMYLSGLVFKEFEKAAHVISVDQIERLWIPSVFGKFEDWPKVMVIDPHDRRSDAIFWAALAPDGTWIVYDEYPDKDFYSIKSREHDIQQTMEQVRKKEAGETDKEWKALHQSGKALKIYRRVIDRRKGAQNVSDLNLNVADVYMQRAREIGYPLTIKLSYDDGNKLDHKIVHEALRFERDETGMIRRPKLVILRDCKNTIHCFQHYSWDDWEGKAGEKKGLKEQVRDAYKDYIDLTRYLLGEQLRYERIGVRREERKEERGYRVGAENNWLAA